MTNDGTPPQAPEPVNPVLLGVLLAVGADLLAGPESTLLDRAAFIALPFFVAGAANAGAQAGAEQYEGYSFYSLDE